MGDNYASPQIVDFALADYVYQVLGVFSRRLTFRRNFKNSERRNLVLLTYNNLVARFNQMSRLDWNSIQENEAGVTKLLRNGSTRTDAATF